MGNTLAGLGVIESVRVLLSYFRWQLAPYRQVTSFEHWVTNHFGQRLFKIFFESYTEKVWGISCKALRAEWAAQRIKDMSLKTVLSNLFKRQHGKVKSLIQEFHYPRQGPGMLWEAVAKRVTALGGEIAMETSVVAVHHNGTALTHVTVAHKGQQEQIDTQRVISSMPLGQLVQCLHPPAPAPVLQASRQLKYRNLLTVGLIIEVEALFPDNWIYIHDPQVKVGRIQNFKNWSPDMVPDPHYTSLGLEYFCQEGDELWSMSEPQLIALAHSELLALGIISHHKVSDGKVYRVPKAYPIYDGDYAAAQKLLREHLASIKGLVTVGRNGLHRYNNQDHSMLTAYYAARNLLLAEKHDLWAINADAVYLEEEYIPDEEGYASLPTGEVEATI